MKLISRPQCPQGHPGRIWLDGTYGKWSPYHERARFTCMPANGLKRHRFTYSERMRHPTPNHPHSGDSCPTCEHTYNFGEGPRTGHNFTFTVHEIARTLIEVGRGESFRRSGQIAREVATRFTTGTPDASREAQLAMQYIDVFADLIIAKHQPTHWPAVVTIDVLPLRKRRFNPGGPRAGSEDRGGVVVAIDNTKTLRGRALMIHLAGGRDRESFAEFFRLLQGAPEVVVADAELGLDAAMAKVPGWENTILYRCEGHLIRNAEKAAYKDGLEKWRKIDLPEPTGPADMWPQSSKSDKEYELSPVWNAIETCQWNEERWQHLKEVVAAEVPTSQRALRKWIGDTESLVLEQMHVRRARRGRPMRRGNGAAERVGIWLRDQLRGRSWSFGNEMRLRRMLALMCLEDAGVATEAAYAGILRAHFQGQRGRSLVDWFAARDKGPKSSLDQLLDTAEARARSSRVAEDNERRARELAARKAKQDTERRAAGMSPARGRRRRTEPQMQRPTKGLMVTAFPDLIATWDWARNAGLDPATTKASWKERVWWQCPVDESHHWQREVIYRARRAYGCPYCMNRKVCRTNSLRAAFPDVAVQWHPTKNGTWTPDDVLPGADKKAWWLCVAGHDFEQLIAARTKELQGCPFCQRERVLAAAIQQGGGAAQLLRRRRRRGALAPDPASPPPNEDF